MFGQQVACFSAFQAIVLSVLAQADLVIALAQTTILIAVALLFDLFANHAFESFSHVRTIPPNPAVGK